MDRLVITKMKAASEHLCSEKLIRITLTITVIAAFIFTLAFTYMGLGYLVLADLLVSFTSLVCLFHLHHYHKPKIIALVVASTMCIGLIVQIKIAPEHMLELGLSFSFVIIILASAGAFITSIITFVIIIVAIGLLSPTVASSNNIFLGFFQAYTHINVFSLSSFVIVFGLGGMIFTHHLFHMHCQIYTRSFLDTVTQLPNRASLEEHLERYFSRYQTHQAGFHVIFADAEGFGNINDLFGHDVGDEVLLQIGQRLRKACHALLSEGVNVFRFGADEFVITIPYQLNDDTLQTLLDNLQAHVGSDYKVGDYEISTTLVMGISTSGKSAHSAKDLLRFADIAVYAAKRSGNQLVLYPEKESSDWDRRFIIHQHLSKALENGELRPVFQPVYDIPTLRLMGCEVLIRWNSDELGTVAPDEFISVAEVSGLINGIGQYVFDQSVEMIETLTLVCDKNLKIAVNVSPYQLKNRQFYEYASHQLREKPNLIPSLELEITESSSFVNSKHATQALREFRKMGLQLSLDDYGTGSTSFMSLQQGAFTRLKLDKSLLDQAMADKTKYLVIKAAVDSAHSLGLGITVEGVETPEQYKMVEALGCTAVQGYFFSKPLEKDSFITLFKEQEVFPERISNSG